MSECPHCGSSLPPTQDAFCTICHEALDEPVIIERTPDQKADRREEGKRHMWAALFGVLVFIKVAYWGLRFLGDYFHPR